MGGGRAGGGGGGGAGGRPLPRAAPLASLVARGGSELVVDQHDLAIDRIAGGRARLVVPAHRLADLLGALESAVDVKLDGRTVKSAREPVTPRATVEDAPGGDVILRIDRDPRVTLVVAPGVALLGDTLHPLAMMERTGPSLEKLPLSRQVAPGELGELVTSVLPELSRSMPVDIRTKRLPRAGGRLPPRIALSLSQEGHTLSVLPTIVYGDPPQARVDAGKLVHLSGPVPARDEAGERALVQRLRDELHLLPGRRVDYDGSEAIRFAERLKGFDASLDGAGAAAVFGRRPLVPRLTIRGDAFDLTFESPEDGATAEDGEAAAPRTAPAAAVLRAWQDGLGLVPLDGGGFAPLPESWLAEHGARLADLLAARREDGEVAPFALPVLKELCEALDHPPPPGLARLAPLFADFEGLPEAELPADLTAELRPYQRHGVRWLAFLRSAGLGAVLADDMGLGKTLQALCAVRGRTLIVCPRSVVFNWVDEAKRFRPGLRVAVYHGPTRELEPEADLTITTYALLRLDAELLATISWDTIVLDEAQSIKNPDSQVARAAYGLRGAFRMSLSGTPVENRLDELWSQLHFTNPGLLGGRRDFQERYTSPIASGDHDAAARLERRIHPFVLRRLKRVVAPELPPRTDAVLHVELDETERAVYDTVRAATKKELVARLQAGASVIAALEALLRLRQAACHPALVPGQEAASSAKVERLLYALEGAASEGHKALVFSQWTSLLDLIEPHLRAEGIDFVRLDGSTRDRAGVVSAFQAAGGPPVMLLSLKAGGTGLNLTAADHVFLMDPWWNPAVEEQAADRTHRIGQDRPVLVYRLVAKDTVEERILALQEQKRALANLALGEAARGLTREDLLALLD